MKAIRLRTADMKEPLGIDIKNPRLSWNAADGVTQTAYRLVAKDADSGEILYDTGKVFGSHMFCRYQGTPLTSRQRVTWQVALWDEKDDHPTWSETAVFEMGLLNPSDWEASWIAGVGTDVRDRLPADYFRRVFRVKKGLLRARLYATAHGMYSASINCHRVSSPLAPGTTQYDKRLYYQSYDITPFLHEDADNELILTLGDGWFKGKIGSDQNEYFFGTQTAVLAQAELVYLDGSREIIGTDDSFLWTNDGPIRFADLKDGEIYDARKAYAFDQKSGCYTRENPYTQRAAVLHELTECPTASNAPLIAEREIFRPTLLTSPSGAKILDFGQNFAGYVRFSCTLPEGREIRLRLFEALDHGEFSDTSLSFPANPAIGTVKQEIVYTSSGRPDVFQPEFFYSGFRYALAEGLEEVDPQFFEGVAVYSDLEYTGEFDCSEENIMKFLNATRWSMKSNFVDVPTDCPQREKSGWTGDAQVFCRTAAYLAQTEAFYRKWLKDVRDCQREDGLVQDVNPICTDPNSQRAAVNGAVGWADAAVIIPYTLWKLTGDASFITDNEDLMCDFAMQRMNACADKSMYDIPEGSPMAQLKPLYDACRLQDSEWNGYVLESGIHWGEWCVPQSQEPSVTGDPISDLLMPKQEVGTAYTCYSLRLLAEMMEAIGDREKAKKYREFSEGAKKAYHVHWVKNGVIETNRMAELVRPLALGLLTAEEEAAAAEELNRMVIARNYKVGTGFLSTPFLLQALAEHGYKDSAYHMLENTEAPGWLAMVKKGATSVWEDYECYDAEDHPLAHSFNHYSPGAVCSFLFDTVAGVSVDGENHVVIRPVPGGSLTRAAAKVQTPYGLVTSAWNVAGAQDGKTEYQFSVTIPANMTATLCLPDGFRQELAAGSYVFSA